MYNNSNNRREVLKFKRFQRKGYSLFACLGREVIIGTLSVATLSHAKAEGVSVEPLRKDTIATKTDRELTLDEVSITGSRAPLTRSQAARMVTVLDRGDIVAAPVQSINDLLKYAAGVDVRQKGAAGALTDVSIRGGNSEQITILLNGINICDPQTGHNAFDFPIDISEIERIEVLEGPAGRVYGTSSLLGAINIVTRTENESSAEVHAEGGSYGYLSTGARANIASGGETKGETKGKWNNQVSGSYTRSDGFSRNKAGALNADLRAGKAFYQGSYDDSEVSVRWHAGMSVKDFGSNTFYGTGSDDQFEHTMKTYTAVQAETKRGRLHLRPSVYWNRTMDRFEYYRGDDAANHSVPYNYHRTDVFGASLNTYLDWSLGRTAICAELRNEDLISTTLGETLETTHHVHGTDREYTRGLNRTNISFVVEHNVILRQFTLSAGIVAVKNSWNNMNMRVYPGVDMSYRIGDEVKLFASYNSSLRMPSATELYYSVGGHKADKYLKPEEAQAVEGGVKYASRGISGSASVYYNHFKNMIDWIWDTTQGDEAIWESVNFTKINATGVKVSLSMDFAQIIPSQHFLKSLDLSYNYLNQDKDIHENIQSKYALEYLRHKFVARLQTHLCKHLDLGVFYRYQDRTGTYTDTDGNVAEYSPYGIVDARLSWNAKKYSLYVEANNIFDKTYVDYGNVAQPGAWIIAGARIVIGD